jgi:D-serine dehydratase
METKQREGVMNMDISSILVDDEDLSLLRAYNWKVKHYHRGKGYKNFYVRALLNTEGKIVEFLLHRLIMKAEKGEIVDHINGNTLDNRKQNLRLVNATNNSYNKKVPCTNTTGYKGVVRRNCKRNPFCAFIQEKKKQIYLGYFATAKEAAEAYDAASLKYHGEFGRTNKSMGLL